MSYIILFETSSFSSSSSKSYFPYSCYFFFLILLHAGPKVPHLTFPERLVCVCVFFFFFPGGAASLTENMKRGDRDGQGCRHLAFFFPSLLESRKKKEKMISLSNVTSDWTRKDGLGVTQHSTVPSPTSKDPLMVLADKISAPTARPGPATAPIQPSSSRG